MNQDVLNEAIKRFDCRDYEKAICLFRSIADDQVLAMYYLGAMYRMGLGVKEDQKEAFRLFLKAADLGHTESQFLVGCAYTANDFFFLEETELVKFDWNAMRLNWLKDTSIWQDSLPFFELSGIGTEPNEIEAIKWISRAADQDYGRAQAVLAEMYDWGIGVEEDKNKAYLWYEKAANNGDAYAMRRLAFFSTENKEDIKRKIELLQKAYELGDYRSAYILGNTYQKDNQEEGHNKLALYWYMISAEKHKFSDAQQIIGDLYVEGKVLEFDITNAINWYKKSIETFKQTHDDIYYGGAYQNLIDLYEKGYKDLIAESEYIEYLKDAATNAEDSAIMKLREYYKKGHDVGEHYKMYFELLDNAEQGDKYAQIKFSYLYVVDKSIDKTTINSVKSWFLEDAVNGNIDAQYLLAHVYSIYSSQQEHQYWLKKAANQQHSSAQYKIAIEYKDENPSEYIKYIQLASENNVYAQIELGYNYSHGKYVYLSYFKAYNLYQKAADIMKQIKDIRELRTINNVKVRFNAANDEAEKLALNGDIDAQLYMGCLYQYGFEVKRNINKAKYWYELATANGSLEASMQLIIIDKEMT